jgi:hypothetical protein
MVAVTGIERWLEAKKWSDVMLSLEVLLAVSWLLLVIC